MSSNKITVVNADVWTAQPQLRARTQAGQVIPDLREGPPAAERMAAITDPAYWAGDPRGLAEALADLASLRAGPMGSRPCPDLSPGAVAQGPDGSR